MYRKKFIVINYLYPLTYIPACFFSTSLFQQVTSPSMQKQKKKWKEKVLPFGGKQIVLFHLTKKNLLLNLSLGRKNEGTLTTIVLFPLFSKSNYPKTLFFHMQTQPTVFYTNVYFLVCLFVCSTHLSLTVFFQKYLALIVSQFTFGRIVFKKR